MAEEDRQSTDDINQVECSKCINGNFGLIKPIAFIVWMTLPSSKEVMFSLVLVCFLVFVRLFLQLLQNSDVKFVKFPQTHLNSLS